MLVEAMNKVDRQSYLKVTWRSNRSDELQSASGIVVDVVFDRNSYKELSFRRDDGQLMIIKGDLKIYSPGSHFPLTGSVVEIEVQ